MFYLSIAVLKSQVTNQKEFTMYKVDYFDVEENNWVLSSFHKNKEYAVINMQVLVLSGKKARVIYKSNIIEYAEPTIKL